MTNKQTQHEIITIDEFILRVKNVWERETVQRKCKNGEIPSTKSGGMWMIDWTAWQDKLATQIKEGEKL